MNIAVTGASGLLGRAVVDQLRQFLPTHNLLPLVYSRKGEGRIAVDLTDRHSVVSFFKENPVQLIIHCAAERRPDVVSNDPESAEALNLSATRYLGEVAAETGAKLIYISTDYVFDGSNSPYLPQNSKNPLNLYGKLKSDGEDILMNMDINCSLLRVPILYGAFEYLSESAVTLLAEKLIRGEAGLYDHYAVRYPTLTSDIAKLISLLVKDISLAKELPEIIHFSGKEPFTKYEMTLVMAEVLGVDTLLCEADCHPDLSVPRPFNAHLESSETYSRWPFELTPFRIAMQALLGSYSSQ